MRLGDAKFLNLFSQIAARTNSDRDCDAWKTEGVLWQRQRVVNWTAGVSFQIETHQLSHAARNTWVLLYVHEMWWGETRDKTIRNMHWVRLQSGSRKDVLGWFKDRELEIEK